MKILRLVTRQMQVDLSATAGISKMDEPNEEMLDSKIDKFRGTEWTGPAELWIDPMGNEAAVSQAVLKFGPEGFTYRWSHEGQPQNGEIKIVDSSIQWRDSWHQSEFVQCAVLNDSRGILSVEYNYSAGPGPKWFWRIKLSQRPDESCVLQMTNIAPWGEEGRAVRMILSQKR